MKKLISNNIQHFVAIGLLTGIIISILLQINANKQVNELKSNNTELYKDYEISEKIDDILLNLSLVESAQRGYIITGEKIFLKDFELNEAEIKVEMEELRKFLEGRSLFEEFNLFKGFVEQKIEFANHVVALYNDGDVAKAMSEVESGKGARIMENILDITTSINKKVKVGMDNLISETEGNVSKLSLWNLIGSGVAISMALIAIFLLYRDIRKRNQLQKKLNIALHEANRSLQIKRQFMSNMSHEIRTPMNAVLGFTSLLNKTELNHKQKEYLDTIQKAGDNLLAIINDILDFSKIEAGMLTLENIPFNINDICHNVFVLLNEKAKEKNIKLDLKIDKNIPELVNGDPTRLYQILINLAGNSIKFTNKGSVEISVFIKKKEEEKIFIGFEIKDTGVGIPEEQLQSVFEEFNQGNSNTTREFGGTGLGLSIVRNLVDLQKGRIQLKSKENVGTSVTFHIPYSLSNATSKTIIDKANTVPTSNNLNSNLNILVVEDNSMNQILMTNVLGDLNISCEIADNGQVALQKLKSNSFDLILMDLQMPVMDGYQTTKIIKEDLKLSIPIVAMSANIMPEDIDKCRQLGMIDFLSKPFKEPDLIKIINQYTSQKIAAKADNVTDLSKQEVLDLNYLYEMTKGKKEFINEMLSLFIQQSKIDVGNLVEAGNQNNLEKIKSLSHKLKTSVRFVGLYDKIGSDLDYLENGPTESASNEELSSRINKVDKVCKKAREEAEKLLHSTDK